MTTNPAAHLLAKIKCVLPVFGLLLLLSGCTTPAGSGSAGSGPAGSKSAAKPGPVATIKGDPAGATENFMGDEIHCQMESIDGETVGSSYQLRPGQHTLIATLASQGKDYVGVIQLLIPAAKSYRVTARRKEDAVTVSLVDEDAKKFIATSTAPLSPHMKFYVFVVQK